MKKILFVHDTQASPASRQNLLEMAGYEVQPMPGARELFVALRENEPDLLLIDVLIEGPNGFETVGEVSSRYPERKFPIVLCSRIYRARQFREEAFRAGAQDYMLLPVQPEAFLRRLDRVLQSYAPRSSRPPEADPAAA